MGESANGVAILGGLHAGDTYKLQIQGGRYTFRREAGLRVFCARTERKEDITKGLC